VLGARFWVLDIGLVVSGSKFQVSNPTPNTQDPEPNTQDPTPKLETAKYG
jgi:hypothetical protein